MANKFKQLENQINFVVHNVYKLFIQRLFEFLSLDVYPNENLDFGIV